MEASKSSPRKFKNDADRIVHRHLENKDDKITEEDLQSVRVGLSSDEGVETGTEATSRFDMEDDEGAEKTANDATALSLRPRSPWEVID